MKKKQVALLVLGLQALILGQVCRPDQAQFRQVAGRQTFLLWLMTQSALAGRHEAVSRQ